MLKASRTTKVEGAESLPLRKNPEQRTSAPEALGAMRAWAILIVILGHAIVPYMSAPIPDVTWAVQDRSTHSFFDWLFLGVIFITMPVFLFSAGYVSAKKLEIQGARAFLSDRVRRTLLPFMASIVVILPLVYYAWAYGWLLSGRCTVREILLAKFSDPEIRRNFIGPAHLWFLEYLFLVSAAYPLLGKWRLSGRLEKTLTAFPLLVAVPTAMILLFDHNAALIRYNTFFPLPFRLAHFGYFFLVGALVRRSPALLNAIEKKGVLLLGIAAPAFIAAFLLSQRYLSGEIGLAGRFALACATAFYAWSVLLGGISWALRTVKKQGSASRTLSDASFSIYLVHMPVVGLIQDVLYRFGWPAGVKVFFAFSGTLFLSFFFHQTTRIPDYLTGVRPLGRFTRPQKWALTSMLLAIIFAVGCTYQFLYNREKARYREAVVGLYRKHLGRKPDRIGLEHWTMMALNKWGLEKVEQIGFIEAKAKGAK
jgi:surface polysaccharide O-acyltransferase-like enzyme